MSNLSKNTGKISNWFWFSLIPGFGGLAIVYGGSKANNNTYLSLGIGITIVALIFLYKEIAFFIWLFQVITAFSLNRHLALKSSSNKFFNQFISNTSEKIDINTCSKHELVHRLELPIVYANDIETLRDEGYMFTHLEELADVAGLPENYLKKLAPIITFSYDPNKEIESCWRQFNSYSAEELVKNGIESEIAQKIVEERQKRGLYRSVIDVRKRTGIPLRSYWDLI